MGKAAPIIAGIAAAGLTLATGGVFLGLTGLSAALAWGAVTTALGFIQQELAPRYGGRDRTTTIRQPVVERRLPFGELIMGGVLTEYEATEDNKWHHMVITLGDAPNAWDDIGIVWLNETPVFPEEIDGDGWVTSGKYGDGVLRIRKYLGGAGQTADPDLISAVPRLDSSFKGEGVAYLYVMLDWSSKLWPNGLPNIKAICRTNTVEDTRDSTRKFTTNMALILREYLTETTLGGGFEAADIDDTQTNASANICDEIVSVTPVGHAVAAVDTANDELDLAVAESGAPLRIETGDRVQIFTDGTAPTGLSTGTNYYAIVTKIVGANLENGTTIALSAGDYTGDAATAISAGDVDAIHGSGITAAIKLATSLDNAFAGTAVTISGAGAGQHVIIRNGEPRYHGAGIHEAGETRKATIDAMLSAMAGRLIWTGGEFQILPGAWRTPITTTFQAGGDGSDLWGPLAVTTKHSRRERFNAVRGIHAPLIALGEQTDYPPVIDSTYVTNDGGTEKFRLPFDLPWTSRSSTAQRLAKIELARHRREVRVKFPTGPKGFHAIPGDVIKVSNTRRSWSEKTFEVTEMEDSELSSANDGPQLRGVTLSLSELDSTAFDFDPATDETVKAPQPAAETGSPFSLAAPSGLTFSSGDSELFVKADGTVVSRLKVAWTTLDGFTDRVEVQYKPNSESTYESITADGDAGFAHIWDVEDGISYDIRVRSISNVGTRSDWTTDAHTVTGKSAAPADVSTFNITPQPDGTRRFTWTATEPADVRAGGGFKIKYVGGTGGVWSGMSELHTGLLSVSPFETNELAAGTYTFGIKMVDSSGNESANALTIEATLGDPRLREVLVSRDEYDLGWPGTKTDCFVNHEGFLESTGAQTWADLSATWDALADSWNEIVNSTSPITYVTGTIDLGSDVTFTPLVSVEPAGSATITMKTGTDADGAPVGSFVATGTVTARYIQIQVSEASTDPILRSLVTLLDAETQVEDYEDIDTSASSAGRFERIATGHFKLATRNSTSSITSATIRAFQNAGSGWTWELISKSTTITADSEPAAEFKIYQNGTLTDATVDVEIKGPKK